jgi:hypothetical protein
MFFTRRTDIAINLTREFTLMLFAIIFRAGLTHCYFTKLTHNNLSNAAPGEFPQGHMLRDVPARDCQRKFNFY